MLVKAARTRTAPCPFSMASRGITRGSIGGTFRSVIPGKLVSDVVVIVKRSTLVINDIVLTFRDVGAQMVEADFYTGVDVGVGPVAWFDVFGCNKETCSYIITRKMEEKGK